MVRRYPTASPQLLACVGLLGTCFSQPVDREAVKGKVSLLWPIHFSSVPLSTSGASSLETPELGRELARLGLERYQAYVTETLPRELEADPELRGMFHGSDHSRVNIAFQRWQTRAVADYERLPVEQVSTTSGYGLRVDGINYSWPELYDSPEFRKLKVRITELSKLYLRRSRYTEIPARFRIFVWTEVYKYGDALRPGARTDGAYLMGRYFASVQKGSLKLNFEDPRGINPPYGKTFSHAVYEGNLVLYPTWVSHLITPNMYNHTSVCFSFLVYPPDGERLDWENDMTGQLVISRPFSVSSGRGGSGR